MTQPAVPETFTVFVNPAIPMSELLDALFKSTGCRMGNVDVPWHALKTKKSAPPHFSSEMKMRCVSYSYDLSIANAVAFIGEHEGGTYQPATAHELVVFLTTFVEEQLKYPIIALGESGDERGPIAAYAYMFEGQRMIFVGRPSNACKWEAGCRFLVVER